VFKILRAKINSHQQKQPKITRTEHIMKQFAWVFGSLSLAGMVVSWNIIDIARGAPLIIGWVALVLSALATGYFLPYIIKSDNK